MGVVSVWVCDVCNNTIKSEDVFELRAYGRRHIQVCEKCLGKGASKAARTTKELKNDS
uniref:Uncharacterized protein n=1 Tax=viral metagenome TaxID=1070528 RepID=A0A6M3XAH3_9ZZZZ